MVQNNSFESRVVKLPDEVRYFTTLLKTIENRGLDLASRHQLDDFDGLVEQLEAVALRFAPATPPKRNGGKSGN